MNKNNLVVSFIKMINLLHPEFSDASILLKTIFETAIDGIITIDKKGTIQMANAAISKLFQYSQQEMIGKNISLLMPEPHRSKHPTYIEQYLKTAEAKIIGIGREAQGQRKDGSLFPLRLSVSKCDIDNKEIFTGIIHDLTNQKEIEENVKKLNQELETRVQERTNELNDVVNKLLRVNKQLAIEIKEREKIEATLRKNEVEIRTALEKEKELNELKSRFVTMASHEFRTPLSTILSSSSLISLYPNKEDQPKRQKHIHKIKSAVNNLTNILDDFLSLSKMEEGSLSLNNTEFNFQKFCIATIEEIEGLLKSGQSIHHNFDEKLKQNIKLDQRLLKNILYNLFSNAIKYSSEGNSIFCHSEIKNNQLIISIQDEGIGIPKADQIHLFTRFFRAANVTNIQGTGLGLNIVRRYVELMDGTISFNSKLDNGSTFTIKIPLV